MKRAASAEGHVPGKGLRVGCAIHSSEVPQHRRELFHLPCIELEDCLHAGFLDQAEAHSSRIRETLAGYGGEIIVSGPFIDLNPGSPERLNVEITRTRFEQACAFARAVGAVEVVFLSSFLPIVNLSSYEEDWVSRSIRFWQSFLDAIGSGLVISLGNTFEYSPDYLVRIAKAVDRPTMRLAVDLGHCLVYSRTSMEEWARRVSPYASTVYVHSNNGLVDTHDEPFRGVLEERAYLGVVSSHLAHCRFIAKMNNRQAIRASIDWTQQHAV